MTRFIQNKPTAVLCVPDVIPIAVLYKPIVFPTAVF